MFFQDLLDAFIHFAQRLADGAAIALAAFAANGDARRNEQRPSMLDHFKRGNHSRVARQGIAAVDAVLRPDQPDLGQPLQNLGQRFLRDAVGFGDILGGTCAWSACSARCFMAMSP